MALGTITVTSSEHKAASNPFGFAVLSFAGDGDYQTGGTAAFQAAVRTAMGRNVGLLAVVPIGLNDGFDAIYDKANDKLIVKAGNVQSSLHDNLSTTTFKLGALYV